MPCHGLNLHKRCGFLFISAVVKNPQDKGHLKLKNFLARSVLSSHRARLAGHVRDRHLCFFMGSLIRLSLHELCDLYIGTLTTGYYWYGLADQCTMGV